jgi:ribosomal protein S18 acetylase RimI-like enzyme
MTTSSNGTLSDNVTTAFVSSMSLFAGDDPGHGLSIDEAGIGSLRSAVANGVMATRRDPDPEVIRAAAQPFLESGAAWSIQVRGDVTPELTSLAVECGLVQRAENPMFYLDKVPSISNSRSDARISRIESSRRREFVTALALGYGAPEQDMASFTTRQVFDHPGVRAYGFEEDGAIQATALTTRFDDFVGLFNVSTRAANRRQGHGKALSERALADGFAQGAHGAYLRSSDMARSLYEGLGFTPLEVWSRFF